MVDKIISPGDDKMTKNRKIFNRVQDNIRYIAFEDGMRGFIPHKASEILEKRYGDCKDMANMIVSMLRVAGITSYYTWIGSRAKPYRYSQLTSPYVDNHMIATYIDNGRYYFLDATDNHCPLGYPTAMIQGKEAFILFDSTHYNIQEVPVLEPEKNEVTDSSFIDLEKGKVIGHGKISLTGYAKDNYTYSLLRSEKTTVDNNINMLLNRGSNKFFVDSYHMKNLEDRDRPLLIDYRFHTDDYYSEAGNEIYINMNLDKFMNNEPVPDNRVTPYERGFKVIHHYITTLRIPAGYDLTSLPPDRMYNDSLFSYHIRYLQKDHSIVQDKIVILNYLYVYRSQFERWNDFDRSLGMAYKDFIILKRN